MTATANLLPYADLPSRWGVTREQTPAGLWVVVPPVPSWRYMVKSHGWAVIPFGAALALAMTAFFFRSPMYEPAVLEPIGIYGSLFVLVAWHAWRRLRTRTVFRVTLRPRALVSRSAAPCSCLCRASSLLACS